MYPGGNFNYSGMNQMGHPGVNLNGNSFEAKKEEVSRKISKRKKERDMELQILARRLKRAKRESA
jgi:hypothetical protein